MTAQNGIAHSKTNRLAARVLPVMAAFLLLTLIFISPAQAQLGGAQPPPVGDGDTPMPVTPGDTSGAVGVPSGTADNTSGSNFSTGTGHDRTVVRLYKQDTNGRGQRMVQTLRPDTLSDDALNQINGILGINMLSGEQAIDVTVSDQQLEQINQAMASYPQTTNNGSRKQITSDAPGAGYPRAGNTSSYAFPGTIPTVATFGRYLVILGVVAATIFMALAAYSMVLGSPYGGARVLGTAAGLMMLLAAYTIWKIVQMNTFGANPNNPAINRARSNDAQVQDAFLSRPNTPTNPNDPVDGGATARPGVPVQPLGNAGN
jgi:hypothetical protein